MILINLYQTASDVKEIISTNDATIQGILLGVILALGATVIYLYREHRLLQKENVKMLEKIFEITIKQKDQYYEYLQLVDKMFKNKE